MQRLIACRLVQLKGFGAYKTIPGTQKFHFRDMFSDRTQFSSPSSPSSSSASSADDVPNRPTDADAAADSFYMDLEAVGGVHWSKAETSFLRFKGAQRTRIFTLPEFPPGFEQASFPTTLPELGVRASCSEQRVRFKTELLSAFDASIQSEDWAYALRCAIAAEIVRRTARIHAARGEPAVSEFGAHGGLYHAERALPAPPRELRPIFHGIDYGSSPRELAFMQAVGVQPIAGRVAGFECVDPIHVVVRTRNAKTKRYVNVPAVVAKASVSEYDDPTPLEVLVRRCRRLVAECEACDSSPLCLLDLQVLACIPSGRIRLPAPGGAAVHYEHLYGAVNDTRRFWLTSYHTDRRPPAVPVRAGRRLRPGPPPAPAAGAGAGRLHGGAPRRGRAGGARHVPGHVHRLGHRPHDGGPRLRMARGAEPRPRRPHLRGGGRRLPAVAPAGPPLRRPRHPLLATVQTGTPCPLPYTFGILPGTAAYCPFACPTQPSSAYAQNNGSGVTHKMLTPT